MWFDLPSRPDRGYSQPAARATLWRAARRLVSLVLPIVAAVLTGIGVAQAQGPGEAAFIQQTIDRLSVEEKVGQLFLVPFQGTDTAATSEIAQLIRDYHVAGVVLSPAHGNIRNDRDTPRRIAEMTNSLQALALEANKNSPLPLFVAVSQEGDGYPFTSLRAGFTPLPSPMSLGATWRDANSLAVGRIVGQELAAVVAGPAVTVRKGARSTRRRSAWARSTVATSSSGLRSLTPIPGKWRAIVATRATLPWWMP